ncbi:ArdC family protein [Botrimarina hoheduenensis]|uniref:DNA primase TraC n=1 Tax=Botrimarina hoheduenensis TaxID=2528000 RepID=A0A5C5WDC8_9BACT|nr:zincin-like metallopeptidase domain-containing protein [Botrimarina hoheduenensis]TWT48946.1 DNA primase TraC [Botrimarina hoheduenensis]
MTRGDRKKSTQKPRRDIYQEVTDRILELLDWGVAPWRQPIKRAGQADGMPKSFSTGKNYRGINVFLLAMTSWAHGYESDYWATFNQISRQKGNVKKGEKSTLVVFWKQAATKDRESGEEITIPVLRHYNVFNAEQCEGVVAPDQQPVEEPTELFVPIEEADRIVTSYPAGPVVQHTGSAAMYLPSIDTVRIAAPDRFETRESYYATLFHELAHSTGHKSRLNRDLGEKVSPFGSPDYSKEELVAEMGSAFLCAAAGISPPTIEQSAAYIDGWRKKLKDDKKLVVQAAGQGQRAADLIRGVMAGVNSPDPSSS